MKGLTRAAVLACALSALWSAPASAQRRVQLDVGVPSQATPVTVTATGLFGDPDMRELVRSGFPASLRYRLELWRAGGLFNDLEGAQEWELIVQYDPSGQRYRVVRREAGRLEDLGSFATLAKAMVINNAVAPRSTRSARRRSPSS